VEGQSVAITGAKMMGKSSLLNFLASPHCETYYQKWRSSRFRFRFVYLDLRELIAKTRDELILKLASEVSTAVSGPFEGDTYEKAQKWLQETTGKRNAGGPLWIFLLDEFDQIIELEAVLQSCHLRTLKVEGEAGLALDFPPGGRGGVQDL
jgi:hypothetical protein